MIILEREYCQERIICYGNKLLYMINFYKIIVTTFPSNYRASAYSPSSTTIKSRQSTPELSAYKKNYLYTLQA